LKFVDNILYLPHELNEQYIQEVYQIFNKEGMDMAQAEKTKEIITFGELLERWKKEGKEEGRKVGRKEGIEEGKREGQFLERRKMAQKMANAGLDIETIISLTGFSEDEIKQILKEG
jgi:predicted transposase/invertase (TIGR01784 family)